MRVYLSGPMGAGKSTVARLLAERLATEGADLDARIEAIAGDTVAEIFRSRGEHGFRALEREALAALPASVGVVSLGGGTVADDSVRRRLLREGMLVTLTAPVDVLVGRVGGGEGRPLLGGDPESALQRLCEQRKRAYAEAHGVIDTGSLTPAQVVDAVVEMVGVAPLVVPLGERTYRVEVGRGNRQAVGKRAAACTEGSAIVVHDGDDARPWPGEVVSSLERAGKRVVRVVLPGDEAHKDIASVERIWDAALGAEVDRGAILVGVGGGVIGDLSGFAASTLLRGVALAQVPTTLLGMVDSSVGGKTGFNRRQGKNLVGTFYQPKFVLCDVETLATLPDAERVAGLAEVVKSAWLEGEAQVAMLERDAEALVQGDTDATIRAVRMSVALKSRVVSEDERESGARMLLNLGHTIGHALEAAADYRGVRHGEAVALGMVAAMRVAQYRGEARPDTAQRLTALLSCLGLPIDLDTHLSPRALGFLGSDKKRRQAQIRFVIPGLPGQTQVLPLSITEVRASLGRA